MPRRFSVWLIEKNEMEVILHSHPVMPPHCSHRPVPAIEVEKATFAGMNAEKS
jgi:hypothetical protein